MITQKCGLNSIYGWVLPNCCQDSRKSNITMAIRGNVPISKAIGLNKMNVHGVKTKVLV